MEPQKRIVVLDSSSESAGALADYLSGEGFGVCAVSDDGNEGIKLIREYEPDVIVLSLVLKGLDGFGVLDYLREAGGSCSAIVLTTLS